MKIVLLAVIITGLSFTSNAQQDKWYLSKSKLSSVKSNKKKNYTAGDVSKTIYLDPGFGLDYAGLGFKPEAFPIDRMSIFATGGD